MTKAEEIIHECIQNKNYELNLCNRWHYPIKIELDDDSPELKLLVEECTHITQLHLNGNKISDFSFLQFLPNLTHLYLQDNKINLPILPNLIKLYLNRVYGESNRFFNFLSLSIQPKLTHLFLNDLCISDISFLEYLPNLIHLEIAENTISDFLPLKKLKNLNHLNLCRNNLSDISFLEFLPTLTHLTLGKNNISDISPLKHLLNLKYLFLRQNNISDISPLEFLTNLTHLILAQNLISDILPLQNLLNLKYLKLYKNKISNFVCTKYLYHLDNLNLSNNQISDVSFLKFIPNLKYLRMFDNQISDVSNFSELQNLTALNLHNNQISDISNFPILEKLKELYLNNNQISDVSNFPILENLKCLYLDGNQISDFSQFPILPNLTSLTLRYNQISDVSNFSKQKTLKALYLSNNQIANISLQFLDKFPNLLIFDVRGNPIQNIPKEIYNKNNCFPEILHYLQDLENHQAEENKEIKVIFVGNGSVGKTQVAKRLVEQNAFVFDGQHNSTHAIVMLRRKLADFQLNCWDFAGQELYHDTHKIFMQTKALFVLVWDAENEKNDFHTWHNKQYENEKLEYWLKYAEYFGNNSPILVLQNKIDVFSEDLYVEQKEKLKEKYPIVDFLEVSAKTNEGFEAFEQQLTHIFSTHSTFKTPDLPKNWVKIREEIIKLQENEVKIIEFSEFEEICKNYESSTSTNTILDYLHNTGVLYYQFFYFKEKIIINQGWIIEKIYKVLDRESAEFEVIQQQNGIFTYQNMCNIWQNNTEKERWLFMNFMLSAGLAIEITIHTSQRIFSEEHRIFVIPQLLPKEKPTQILEWEQKNKNNLSEKVLFYYFLPQQTIYSFMNYAQKLTNQNIIWRQGILLKIDNDCVLVEVFYEDEKSKIIIQSNKNALIEKIMKESPIKSYAQAD